MKPKLVVTGANFKATGAAVGCADDDFRRIAARRRRPDARCRRCGESPVQHVRDDRIAERRDAHRLECAQCRPVPRARNAGNSRGRPLAGLPAHVPYRRRRLGDLGMQEGSAASLCARRRRSRCSRPWSSRRSKPRFCSRADAVSHRTAARRPPISPRSGTLPTARRRFHPRCCSARSTRSNAGSRSSTGSPNDRPDHRAGA